MIGMFSRSKAKASDGGTPILQLSITFHPDDHQLELVKEKDNEIKNFMIGYVGKLFRNGDDLTLEQKATFGKYVQTEEGQTWFATMINAQRADSKCVSETTFYRLVQHFAIVLFECANSEHFSPAKTLMNMCLTFYHEVEVPGCEPFQEYLSTYLRNQPIWQNLRFWNAAFFDALQCVRIQKPILTQQDLQNGDENTILDEERYQENITFGQLGSRKNAGGSYAQFIQAIKPCKLSIQGRTTNCYDTQKDSTKIIASSLLSIALAITKNCSTWNLSSTVFRLIRK